MTHLSDNELKTWYEQGHSDDRLRVIGHLAECETCRKALAALALAAEPQPAEAIVSVSEALPLGYAARRPSETAPSSWPSWLRPVVTLAGAAAVIVAVLWVTAPRSTPDNDAVRSSELSTLAPAGPANALEFRFASPFNVPRYRVVIRDASGTLVYSGETAASPLVIDESNRGRFATMVEYSWTVSALDAAGEVIAESKPRAFTYQP